MELLFIALLHNLTRNFSALNGKTVTSGHTVISKVAIIDSYCMRSIDLLSF